MTKLFTQYSIFELYRNSAIPLQGTFNGAEWQWPGKALSASTFCLYPNMHDAEIAFARWVLVWNPTAPDESRTGVRLVHAYDGPSAITEMAQFTKNHSATPIVSGVDVTEKLKAIWGAGEHFQVGHQTAGTGSSGALIYGSWVEIGFKPVGAGV